MMTRAVDGEGFTSTGRTFQKIINNLKYGSDVLLNSCKYKVLYSYEYELELVQ